MSRSTTPLKRPEPRTAGRPTLTEAADLRERILRAALDEFLGKGFGGASMEGVARAANVNKDTLYRQFRSKEQLYRASVMHSLETRPGGARASVDDHGDPESVLADAMRRMYKKFSDPRSLAITRMAIAQASLFPDLAEAARADFRGYLLELTEYLRALQAAGVLTFDDPEEAADLVATNAVGGLHLLFDEPLGGRKLDALIRRRLRIFLKGWNYRPRAAKRRARRA
jgi:AcrR family transcriptional regulator